MFEENELEQNWSEKEGLVIVSVFAIVFIVGTVIPCIQNAIG